MLFFLAFYFFFFYVCVYGSLKINQIFYLKSLWCSLKMFKKCLYARDNIEYKKNDVQAMDKFHNQA